MTKRPAATSRSTGNRSTPRNPRSKHPPNAEEPLPVSDREVEVFLEGDRPPLESHAPPIPAPLLDLHAQLDQTSTAIAKAVAFACSLDPLGDPASHRVGAPERKSAALRDELDFALQIFLTTASDAVSTRAKTSRSAALVHHAAAVSRGDAQQALQHLRRFHELLGLAKEDDDAGLDSLPALFATDTFERVSILRNLVDEFPASVRAAAGKMPGWPMIVSAHLDHRPEFDSAMEKLQLGADFILKTGKRKRRFSSEALVPYLIDLVERLERARLQLQLISRRAAFLEKEENPAFLKRYLEKQLTKDQFLESLAYLGRPYPQPDAAPKVANLLRQLPALPDLTASSLSQWIVKIILPFIMLGDAGSPGTCKVAPLKTIWQQRSVSSRMTFRSSLGGEVRRVLKLLVR